MALAGIVALAVLVALSVLVALQQREDNQGSEHDIQSENGSNEEAHGHCKLRNYVAAFPCGHWPYSLDLMCNNIGVQHVAKTQPLSSTFSFETKIL